MLKKPSSAHGACKGYNVRRALLIKQKWLDLILAGDKDWELRSTATRIRGRIFLAQSGTGLIKGF